MVGRVVRTVMSYKSGVTDYKRVETDSSWNNITCGSHFTV